LPLLPLQSPIAFSSQTLRLSHSRSHSKHNRFQRKVYSRIGTQTSEFICKRMDRRRRTKTPSVRKRKLKLDINFPAFQWKTCKSLLKKA